MATHSCAAVCFLPPLRVVTGLTGKEYLGLSREGQGEFQGRLTALNKDQKRGGITGAVNAYEALLAVGAGVIFADGFDSGDTSAWSTTVP